MTQAETASALIAAVNEARSWLYELTDPVVREKPTPDRWSIAEVIGHMIDSACNNHQRFIRAQEVDELTFPKYEQNLWVERAGYDESNWSELVDLWHLYNLQLARVIAKIPSDQLDTPCTITPYETCTLGFLVTDYLDHLNHHLAKIHERIGQTAG